MRSDHIGWLQHQRKVTLALCAVIVFSTTCGVHGEEKAVSEEAPFGLAWGISAQNVRELGVQLDNEKIGEYGKGYTASKLPRVLGDAENVFLFFGLSDRLWRIVAISKIFQNDPYGSQVTARYDMLAQALKEKYGAGKLHQFAESDFYRKPENFMYSLHTGHAQHFVNYETPILSIQLAIRGISSSDGIYAIFFEHKTLKKEFESNKKAEEKKAL